MTLTAPARKTATVDAASFVILISRDAVLLKTFGTLTGNREDRFQRHTHFAQPSLFKQFADQRHSMGYAARRCELRQRMLRVWSPITACLAHLHKSGTQCQGRMSSEVEDHQS